MCVVDIYSKYAWVVSLKDEKSMTITNVFKTFLSESRRKTNKIWADTGSEFYNRSMKSWLQDNDIEMCSKHNEGQFFVSKRFIETWKKSYLYMIPI